jgi:hypothetical protein
MFHVKHRGADLVGGGAGETVSAEASGSGDVSRETFLRKRGCRYRSGNSDSAKQPHALKNRATKSTT